MGSKFIALFAITAALHAQDAKPVIDNGHDSDEVVMWIAGPKARTASFSPRGARRDETGSEGSQSLIIERRTLPPRDMKTRPGIQRLFRVLT